jgi:cytidyltransferase-like protein
LPTGARTINTAFSHALKTTVLAAGVFDLFHPGHRFFLETARQLGDRLIVVVARDHNVERFKGFLPEQGEVVLGEENGDLLAIVKTVSPDILAVGYDQKLPEGLRATFPDLIIKMLPAFEPQVFKSSHLRRGQGSL